MYKKRWLLVPLLFILLQAMVVQAYTAPFPLSDEEKAWLEHHPTIRLGVGVAFPPYMWVEKKGGQNHFKGMVSDYLTLIKERLGVDMQIVFDIPFDEALARGRNKQIDFFPCVSKTSERSKFLLFTAPYLSYPMVILARKDTPMISGMHDLKGKRLAVAKHLVAFSKIQNEYSNLNLEYVFTRTAVENLEAVSLGRADACIISLAAASYYTQKKGLTNLKVAAPLDLDDIQLSMGIRKDWPVFQGMIEKVLNSISQAEKDRISRQWIRVEYEPGVDMKLVWAWSSGIGLGITIIFILIFAWNRRLQKEILKKEAAETAHKESERKLSTLIGNLPGMAYRCLNDENWTMLYLSDGCESLTGYTPSEIISNNRVSYNDLIVPEDRHFIWTEIQNAVKKNRSFTLEYRIEDKTGHQKWVWEKGIILQKDAGRSSIIEGFISDITERKLAETAHKKMHKTFITILDSIDATVYVADIQTHEILFMNKNMIETFGRDMTGEICYEAFRGESKPCSHCPINQLTDRNGPSGDVHVWQAENPKTGRWYINYDRLIEWIDGRSVKLQIATDITDFKQMEEELRQSHKMESIGTLAGGIAHDFNNIISIILGNTELALIDTPDGGPGKKNLQEINTACLRAKEVVSQLLNFSRKTELTRKPQNLSLLIKESVKLLRSSFPANIQIIEKISATSNRILADATQIHQVIINLCTNAAQAMSEKGGNLEIHLKDINLATRRKGKSNHLVPGIYQELIIKDTGTGIDPKIYNKIFDPYFTTKEFGKGTGMGLAVVHGIIKNHSGSIFVDSLPGKGASFSVFFPAVEKHETPARPAPLKNIIPKGTERILFVDDDKAIVEMTLKLLQKLGYQVEGRTRPEEAIQEFEANPFSFDLVITDMTMPQINGMELSKTLKRIRPDLPIIIFTGHSSLLDEDMAKTTGISAYAIKPISMTTMATLIRDVLKK
ncbi:transporter substrate-binding domain-containing protein [Desulfobacula sp.]|uniref:response regulator n=1 Tax=Desulfobacula sp. TaxID=2593537 RepID=UPI002626B19A|nr:transporter substrate-binding domain-containing protein [Desulfobacula sp.]